MVRFTKYTRIKIKNIKHITTHKLDLPGYCLGVRALQSSEMNLNAGMHQLIKVNPHLVEYLLSGICFVSKSMESKTLSNTCVSI